MCCGVFFSGCWNDDKSTGTVDTNQTKPKGVLELTLSSGVIDTIGDSAIGTLKLSGSEDISSLVVSLKSDDTTIATLSSDSCTLSSTNDSCTFTITGKAKGATKIEANAIGYTTVTAPISVAQNALRLVIDKTSLEVYSKSTATLLMEEPENIDVNSTLSSSDTTVATLNQSGCTFSATNKSCTFDITGIGEGSSTIKADASGFVSPAHQVQMVGIKEQLSISLGSSYLTSVNDTTTATITLANSVGINPFTVSVASGSST